MCLRLPRGNSRLNRRDLLHRAEWTGAKAMRTSGRRPAAILGCRPPPPWCRYTHVEKA